MKGRDHSRRSEMASVVIPRETGIAEMTPGRFAKLGQLGKQLSETSPDHHAAPSSGGRVHMSELRSAVLPPSCP
jgi:hypothetical protein